MNVCDCFMAEFGCQVDLYNLFIKNQLINSLSEINETLSSTPKGSFTESLSGGVVLVVAGFIFNYLFWVKTEKINKDKERLYLLVSKFNLILDTFEKESTEYWSSESISHMEKAIKEDKIKSYFTLLRKLSKKIAPNAWQYSNKEKADLNSLLLKEISSLYDISTGESFESKDLTKNLNAVSSIIRGCNKIRLGLTGLDD